MGSMKTAGSLPVAWALIASTAAWRAASPPCCIISAHRFAVGSAMNSGAPRRTSLITPMPSLWSVTATQSSGCSSFAFWPVFETTSSPRTKRTASSGESVVPDRPASPDQPVWTCSSPHQTRLGWPAPAAATSADVAATAVDVAATATSGGAATATGPVRGAGAFAQEATNIATNHRVAAPTA